MWSWVAVSIAYRSITIEDPMLRYSCCVTNAALLMLCINENTWSHTKANLSLRFLSSRLLYRWLFLQKLYKVSLNCIAWPWHSIPHEIVGGHAMQFVGGWSDSYTVMRSYQLKPVVVKPVVVIVESFHLVCQ